MIEHLRGKILLTSPTGVVIDVNGVGYGLEMPLSAVCQLPPVGSTIELSVYTHVREDAMRLFGFLRRTDRQLFELLLGLSGVGPKVALAILSTLSVGLIREAIVHGKSAVFESVPGIGKRLSEKILVELKPKLNKLQLLPQQTVIGLGLRGPEEITDFAGDQHPGLQAPDLEWQQQLADLQSGLENLGFSEKVYGPLLKRLQFNEHGKKSFSELMRVALAELGGRQVTPINLSSAEAVF